MHFQQQRFLRQVVLAGRSIRSAFMCMLTPFVLVLTGLLLLGTVCSGILTVGCCDVPHEWSVIHLILLADVLPL